MQVVFLDIESTGFDARADRIIEVGAVRWENGQITDRISVLVNPHCAIPGEIIQLTGITQSEVDSAKDFSEVVLELSAFIGDLPIVGHNIQFDAGFLRSHGLPLEHNLFIDTVELARILLLKEASYSLEVLMKKYVPVQRTSHRALADTETTVDFFMFIVDRIRTLPEATRSELQKVLGKTGWPGKDVFEFAWSTESPEAKTSEPTSWISATGNHPTHETWTTETCEQILSAEDKTVQVISASYPDIKALNKASPLCVVYSERTTKDRLIEGAIELKSPEYYLSPRKLYAFIAADVLSHQYTPFALKMTLWLTQTTTGDREELSLDREEYPLFQHVADTNGEDTFWKKNVHAADGHPVLFIHQYAWWKMVHAKLESISHRRLIITDAHTLEDTGTTAHGTYYSGTQLSRLLGERGTILAGLLGMFHRKQQIQGNTEGSENVLVDEYAATSKEWRTVLDSINSIDDEALRTKLLDAFTVTTQDVAYIQNYADEISFHKAPLSLASYFEKATTGWKQLVVHDHTLNLAPLGIDTEAWVKIDEGSDIRSQITIDVVADFPEPNEVGYFKRSITLFTEVIEKTKGGCLFVVSSKKAAAAYYSALKKFCTDRGVHLYATGISGGTGKTASLFLQDPSRSVIFLTPHSLPQHTDIIAHISTMVFQKIPFDPPFDPLTSARGRQFENGFEQYSLPRAIMRFKNILWQFARLSHAQQKTCYLLDSRIMTRSYGKWFI